MSLDFQGDLKKISPNKIIKENGTKEENKLGSFFIGLGVVFNDLKDLIFLEELFVGNYRKPGDYECSDHAGNYGGMMIYINKLFASTIIEFFEFIKENEDIMLEQEFIDILQRLTPDEQNLWNSIVSSACGRNSKARGFLKSLWCIRSNIAFHYDHSGKVLKKGFISYFYSEEKNSLNEKACYSIDDEDLKNTRFYFSDAAVQEALFLETGKKERKKIKNDPLVEKYRAEMLESINIVGKIISKLTKNFLQKRRNIP